MPRSRDSNRAAAFEIYKESNGNIDLTEIGKQLNISSGSVRGWKSKDKWDEQLYGTLQKNTERSKRSKGGQPNNTNATGPPGNKNAVKHGAYENIYIDALPEEERAIFNSIPDSTELDGEIRLLRLKLSRLLGRGEISTYDMFGCEHKRNITEDEREKGILNVTAEIRKLIKTKKQIELAEIKAGLGNDEVLEDDGFMDALNGTAAEDWADEED